MRRWAWFAVVVMAAVAFARPAMAQDASKVEAFAGYSYVRITDQGVSANGNGGSGAISYNLTPMIGIVADFGGYTGSAHGFDGNIISYMFGPRVSYHMGKLTPFAQALFGGSRFSASGTSENDFSMTVGGGLDYALTNHFSVRPVQAEYYMTKFSDGANNRQNNFRYSAGIVYRF